MKCLMTNCTENAVENTKRCEFHTKNPGQELGLCECGKQAKYATGQCGTCYQRSRRERLKVVLMTDEYRMTQDQKEKEILDLMAPNLGEIQAQNEGRDSDISTINSPTQTYSYKPFSHPHKDDKPSHTELMKIDKEYRRDYRLGKAQVKRENKNNPSNKDDYWKNAWS